MDDTAPLANEPPLSVEETTGYSKDLPPKALGERIAGIAGTAQAQVKGPHKAEGPKK